MRYAACTSIFLTSLLLAGPARAEHKSLQEVASEAGHFKTLLAALEAAGLSTALEDSAPVTIFAPNDAAFAKLPEGTVETLLEDLPKLRTILKYHVLAGKVPAEVVVQRSELTTLLGQKLAVDTSSGVRVGEAKVVATDLECKVGVIHAIDSVLLPADDIVDTARKAGSFKTLLAAVEAAGLTDTLRGSGPFTLFAPTDAAFAALPEGTVASLLKDKAKLRQILTYHVVSGRQASKDLSKVKTVNSVQGSAIAVEGSCCEVSGKVSLAVAGAHVVKADIGTANGVVHVIDRVMLPPTSETSVE